MDKLKWIDSTGGPFVLISDNSYKLWSGILKRSSYLENIFEEANDFSDANETDYGKACSVQDYVGVINIKGDKALVFGDEPMLTTSLISIDNKTIIARWCYGESEELVDHHLNSINLNAICNWQLSATFTVSSDRQHLFDSSHAANLLDEGAADYLHLRLKRGQYQIWTSIYKPDEKTKLLIHKFETTN